MRRKNTTTEFLKECMADALFRLLKEKPLPEITITEITELADVGRVTFYRNFTCKEDLIKYKLSLLREDFFENFKPENKGDAHAIAQYLFQFMYENQEILLTLHNANLMETLLLSLNETARKNTPDDPAKRFASSFWVFGITGIAVEWIRNGFQETPEELLEIFAKVRRDR